MAGILMGEAIGDPVEVSSTSGPGDDQLGWAVSRDLLYEEDQADPDGLRVLSSRAGWGMMLRDARKSTSMAVFASVEVDPSEVEDPVEFRLLDDDGIPYYEGRIRRDWIDGDEELAFSPLTWAAADAGCTEMQYSENGEWKVL